MVLPGRLSRALWDCSAISTEALLRKLHQCPLGGKLILSTYVFRIILTQLQESGAPVAVL